MSPLTSGVHADPDCGRKSPASVRYLAGAAHIGFWAGALPLHVFLQPYDWDEYARFGLLMLFAFGPVAAASLVARRSAWRAFLAPHATAALLVHGSAAVSVLIINFLDPPRWELPGVLMMGLWTVSGTTLLCWLVLPFGAAFRALDGSPAWYPLVSRLLVSARQDDPRQGMPSQSIHVPESSQRERRG